MNKNNKNEKDITYKHPFDITSARYDYTLTESRILITMLYLSDKYQELGPCADRFGEIYDGEYGQKILKLPISMLLGNEFKEGNPSQNYEHASKALMSFSKKPISFFVNYEEWREMLPFVLIEKRAGNSHLTAIIAPQTWKFITGLSNRFTCIRIDNMLMMKSKYTMRMHQLVEGMIRPVTYKVETLKQMFKLEKKYSLNKDFFKYVLDVSQEELERLGLTSFEYEKKSIVATKAKGRQPITHVTIVPSYQEILDDKAVRRVVKTKGLSTVFTEEELTAIIKCGFRPEEITANAPAFYNFAQMFDIKTEIKILEKDSLDKDNPKGWVISEMKRRLGLLDM